MDILSIIQMKDSIIMNLQKKYKNIKTKSMKWLDLIQECIETNPGWCIIAILCLLYPVIKDLYTICICGSIVYLTVLIKQYIKNKIDKETLESIDLDRIGNSTDNKKSIIDIINDYTEQCFDRDVLFFNIIDKDDYIDTETERRLLNELLDSAITNMSDEVRNKLYKYIPEEQLIKLISRRCMMIITIFVANHNKNIYQRTDEERRVEL